MTLLGHNSLCAGQVGGVQTDIWSSFPEMLYAAIMHACMHISRRASEKIFFFSHSSSPSFALSLYPRSFFEQMRLVSRECAWSKPPPP